jgi:hypothetical protein
MARSFDSLSIRRHDYSTFLSTIVCLPNNAQHLSIVHSLGFALQRPLKWIRSVVPLPPL